VGDTVDDMVAARAAGMWAIGIVPPYINDAEGQSELLTEKGAHIVLRDTNRLPDVVDRLHDYLPREDEPDEA
jgi:HAD superfamily phosphatase